MTVPPLYYNSDPRSFGFSTARSRWPKILSTAVEDVKIEINNKSNDLKTKQAEAIIQSIESLSEDIISNGIIKKFNSAIPGLNSYDETLSKLEVENDNKPLTWLAGPWLFTECYLYRQLDSYFKSNSEWLEFDIFNRLKRETFFSSSLGVSELIIRYKQLSLQKAEIENNEELLKILYEEFIDVSLWGNATDLSLLANASLDDIKSVQGKEAREKSKKNIIANDLEKSWERLTSSKTNSKKRVDFVLDNAGFEFFTDLCLSLFLLDFKLVDKIVVHCKTRPWMVSDTMIKDVKITLDDLLNKTYFPEHQSEIQFFVDAIQKYQKLGKFEAVDSEFWTVDLDYWNLAENETKYGGADLWKYFQDSTLVIIKGDLNYRKLTGDRHWPRDIPFVTAIDQLSKSGIHLLALRTCKADVCAGLAPGKDEELCKYWESLGNKVGELWCSSGKWAVVSYSDGHN